MNAPHPSHQDPTLSAMLDASRQAMSSGEHRLGLEQAQQARERASTDGGVALAHAMNLEGHHLWRLGRFEDAVVVAREAVPLWQQTDDMEGQAEALSLLAVAYTELGLHEEGLRSATAAFELAHHHGLSRAATLALNRIGVCHERLGDPEQGERFLLQALSRAREERNFDDTLQALNNLMANTLAAQHLYRGQAQGEGAHHALERARHYGNQALAMARRAPDVYRQVVAQGNVAEVLMLAGDYAKAEAMLNDTVARAAERGFRAVELRSRHALAELWLLQGRSDAALQALHAVLDELHRSGDHETTRMRVHSALYRTYKSIGRFEPALAHCEAFHAIQLQRAALQSQAQARLMVNRLDMEQALLMADKALMDAARERMKSSHLEAEKRDLQARSEALHRDAHEDALTGLLNRRSVDLELPRLLAEAREHARPLQLAVLDVDRFKQVNDAHGHATGDEVLRQVAQLLRDRLRSRDLAARLGGEEFLIVLTDTPGDVARDVCERLREAVAQHDWRPLGVHLRVTLSAGLCGARHDEDAASLIGRADAALYAAKHRGRNRVQLG